MTAKQELRELVERMDESEAQMVLSEWRSRSQQREDAPGAVPSFKELLRLPLHERSKWLSRMSFEVDLGELREWDEATAADGLSQDE